jgi:hypothetical protein
MVRGGATSILSNTGYLFLAELRDALPLLALVALGLRAGVLRGAVVEDFANGDYAAVLSDLMPSNVMPLLLVLGSGAAAFWLGSKTTFISLDDGIEPNLIHFAAPGPDRRSWPGAPENSMQPAR